MKKFDSYLNPGEFTNSKHPAIIQYTAQLIEGIVDKTQQVIKIFNSIRDNFKYYPYHLILKPEALKANCLLDKDYGYCVEKSNLFAAFMRVIEVTSRLCFANVRNHLATEKVENYLKTDLMVFHGYVEIFLNKKWIKLTPVFDKGLCNKLDVALLEFDGFNDCIFQESDKEGKPFMHYEHYYGSFSDLPFELFVSELRKFYPHLFLNRIFTEKIIIDF